MDTEQSDPGLVVTENPAAADQSADPGRKASDARGVYDATVTLSNTMIGMSILTFPYTVYRLGWVLSAFILAGAFLYSVIGFNAIIDAAYFLEARSLKGIVQAVTNRHVAMVVDVVMVIHMVGILVVYTSICGDYFHSAIIGFSYGKMQLDLRYLKAIIGVLLIPFMFLRNASKLSAIGIFSTFFIIVTVFSTFIYFIIFLARNRVVYAGTVEGAIVEFAPARETIVCPTEGCVMPFQNPLLIALPAHKEAWKAILEIIRRVSIFMALFGCQISIAPLLAELKGSAVKRRRVFRKSLLASATMVLVLQIVMAISAAFSFSDKLQSNVLLSFPSVEIAMTVIKLLYACVVFIIFILKMFSIRYVVIGWFKLDKDTRKGKIVFYVMGIGIVVLAVLFSIFIPSIDTVFNAISALFGIVTYWLVPLLLIYKRPQIEAMSAVTCIADRKDKRIGKGRKTNKKRKRSPAVHELGISTTKFGAGAGAGTGMNSTKQNSPETDTDEDWATSTDEGAPNRTRNYTTVEETSVDQIGVGFLAFFGLPIKQARAFTKVLRPHIFLQERLLTRQDKHIIRQHELLHKRACSLPASEAGSEEIESAHQMIQDVMSWELIEDSMKDFAAESSASYAVSIYQTRKSQGEAAEKLSDKGSMDFSNSKKLPVKAIKTIAAARKRRNSVSESKPSADYDLVMDTKPFEYIISPSKIAFPSGRVKAKQTEIDPNTLLGAAGQETIANINKEEERRLLLQKKMTKTRLALICCATVVIGIVNLMAFVLSTFVDIETCTWSI